MGRFVQQFVRPEMTQTTVAALYRFTPLPDFESYQAPLAELGRSLGIMGTLLLAREGVNGTIAGPPDGMRVMVDRIRGLPGCWELDVKWSHAEKMPFVRLKVRLKREIVTMGVEGIDPRESVGTYVAPQDWNELIASDDVIVIDTRNDYEVAIGSFEGAINPQTETFRDFPEWAREHLEPGTNKRIAMFCTGGIRCEKSTALLKQMGFENVYHLKGGILKYLEDVLPEDSLWRGECFVFDQRVSVGHGLQPGPFQLCAVCRKPFSSGKAGGGYANGPCPECESDADACRKARAAERQRQIDLAKRRGERHLGPGAQADDDGGQDTLKS